MKLSNLNWYFFEALGVWIINFRSPGLLISMKVVNVFFVKFHQVSESRLQARHLTLIANSAVLALARDDISGN